MAQLSRLSALAAALCLAGAGVLFAARPQAPWWTWALAGAGLLGTGLFIKTRQAEAGKRSGPALFAIPALILGLFFCLEMLSLGHRFQWDLTAENLHSLAPQTISILKSLDRPVQAQAFFKAGGNEGRRAEKLLKAMSLISSRFVFRMIDPDLEPAQAQLHGVRGYATVMMTYQGKSRKISPVDEQGLANGLLQLTTARPVRVLFTTGHGEHSIEADDESSMAQAVQELKNQGYETGTINLLNAPQPNPQTIVILAGPKARLTPLEVELLKSFMAAGGRMMVLLDPLAQTGLAEMLASVGVKADDSVILDRAAQRLGTEPFVVVTSKYPVHPLIGRFNLTAFFPWTRPLEILKDRQGNLAAAVVVQTSETAWAETDLERLKKGEAELDQKDKKGPLAIAVAVEAVEAIDTADRQGTASAGKGFRLVVFGDSDFAANAHINLVGNGDLFLQAVAWLARRDDLITIKARSSEAKPAFLSAAAARLIFWLPVVVLPGLIFIIGLIALWRRKLRG